MMRTLLPTRSLLTEPVVMFVWLQLMRGKRAKSVPFYWAEHWLFRLSWWLIKQSEAISCTVPSLNGRKLGLESSPPTLLDVGPNHTINYRRCQTKTEDCLLQFDVRLFSAHESCPGGKLGERPKMKQRVMLNSIGGVCIHGRFRDLPARRCCVRGCAVPRQGAGSTSSGTCRKNLLQKDKKMFKCS